MIKKSIIIIAVLAFGIIGRSVFAQTSSSVLYVPLIGISSVPQPSVLPSGPGIVTYNYAVKNFLVEVPLADIKVVDDKCGSVEFAEGDDDGDGKLDYNETWRYTCTAKVSITTQSVVTANGSANGLTATHKAYSTVVVGSKNPPPLVSIINITKVAHPFSLPKEGGQITFTYKVNNPGLVPLSNVTVADDKCSAMSGRLGDTNYNNLLDVHEVRIYSCATILRQTTTNTVHVSAFANGLKAVGEASITVTVDQSVPSLPNAGTVVVAGMNLKLKFVVWGILSALLSAAIALLFLLRKHKSRKNR